MMHRQQQSSYGGHQQQPQYGSSSDLHSNPSSTHSSPRTYPSDLEPYYPPHSAPAWPPAHGHGHSQTYPIPAGVSITPYAPHQHQQRRGALGLGGAGGAAMGSGFMQPSRSSSYSSYTAPVSLQVSTSTSSQAQEHDPNERTARPGNAHVHAQFHSMPVPVPPLPNTSSSTASAASTAKDEGGDGDAMPGQQQQGQQKDHGGDDDDATQQQDYTTTNPGLSAGLTRPLKPVEQDRLAHLDRLKFFLATAPARWDTSSSSASASAQSTSFNPSFPTSFPPDDYSSSSANFSISSLDASYHHSPPHPALNRFLLPNQEFVTCVLWNGLYHITGTDIVRALVFRFEAFGRPVRNMKKFEEGVFSDLRNLKPGVDACLEEPKSPFLDLLFKYQCIRTQKKQKVFYWFSVPHDRLFLDALERDLKREKMALESTTHITGEPALSFTYDPKRSLYEQFSKASGIREGEGELEAAVRRVVDDSTNASGASGSGGHGSGGEHSDANGEDSSMGDDTGGSQSEADDAVMGDEEAAASRQQRKRKLGGPAALQGPNGQQFLPFFSIFEGSPTYKQRRKKGGAANATPALGGNKVLGAPGALRKGSEEYMADDGGYERGRRMGSDSANAASGRFSHSASSHSHSISQSRERPSRSATHPYHPLHSGHPYSSMMDEFSNNGGQRSEALSAADMFIKQARGELTPADGVERKPKPNVVVGEVGVFYSDGKEPPASVGATQAQGHARGRSFDLDLHSSAKSWPPTETMSAGYARTTFADAQQFHAQQQQPTNTASYPSHPSHLSQLNPPNPLASGMAQYEAVSADGTIRAFVCPLYSCGRLFKRMEHLKRHLRTHTMERPFTCDRCGKKFSRSDNLSQHLRTHERTGSASLSGGAGGMGGLAGLAGELVGGGPGDWMNDDDADASGGEDGSVNGGSPRGGGMTDSEDDGGIMIGGVTNFHTHTGLGLDWTSAAAGGGAASGTGPGTGMLSLGNLDMSVYGFGAAPAAEQDAAQMQACQVEVPGGLLQADDEGLLMRSNVGAGNADATSGYYSSNPSSAATSGMLFSATTNSSSAADNTDPTSHQQHRWRTQAGYAPSPPPSSSVRGMLLQRNSSLRGPQQQHQLQHTNSTSSSSSASSYTDDYTAASLSAPSHKQSFDHATLYPPNLSMGDSSGVGPTRRHRSMTPSLVRNGEPRRPTTASSDFSAGTGSPGSVHSSLGSTAASGGGGATAVGGGTSRGYHPYAYSASNSRTNSTHNSPQVHSVPLGGTVGDYGLASRRPDSRSSSYSNTGAGVLHEQMRQMMHMDPSSTPSANPNGAGGPTNGSSAASAYGDEIYRSDSPAQFAHQMQTESPARFNIDLPQHGPGVGYGSGHGHGGHASTMPQFASSSSGSSQQGFEGGFYPQQHSTI